MRIKVTGYLDSEDLNPEDVDEAHEMGISDSAYVAFLSGLRPLPSLDELEFEAVKG